MKIIGEVITMAKFVLPDDSIESWDNIKEEKVHHKVSPALMIEMRLIDTLMKISNNLSNETLNKNCILEMIRGSEVPNKECGGDCYHCICNWYLNEG
jgi:hypothetical protein